MIGNILIGLLGLAIFSVVFVCIIKGTALKLSQDMPLMEWVSFDEIIRHGYSRLFARLSLLMLHGWGSIQVRVNQNIQIPDDQIQKISTFGFDLGTVPYYEVYLKRRHM